MAVVVKGGRGSRQSTTPKHRKNSHSHNPVPRDTAAPSLPAPQAPEVLVPVPGSRPARARGSRPARARGSTPARARGSTPAPVLGSTPAPVLGSTPAPDPSPVLQAWPDLPAPLLPVPPVDSEKYSYVRRHAWVLTLCSAVSFPSLVYSQVELIRRYEWFWVYAPFMLMGIAIFLIPLLTDGLSRGFDLAEHRRLTGSWQPRWHPSVDIFLPVCGEPIEVLRNTWNHRSPSTSSMTPPARS